MTEVAFGPFRLDLKQRQLTRGGSPVALGSRALDLLCVLVAARGQVVTKDQLLSQVWPDVVVEENNIQVHVSALRKALDSGDATASYIATLPGRGYRFIGLSDPLQPSEAVGVASPPLTVPERPSIAVLPFANLSGDVEQEYFAEGISEDIITALTRHRWFFVIARNSSFSYKGRHIDVKQVGAELGVRYVLEGSVRKFAQRVRVTVQLVAAGTGAQIWAERYDRDVADVFAVQDDITERVAGAIEPELLKHEGGQAAQRSIGSLNVWDLVRRGTWYFHQLTEATHLRSRELFREAVHLAPELAEAHIWLARAGVSIVSYGWAEDDVAEMKEAMDAAIKAIQLDERDAYAHYALAMAHIFSSSMQPALRFAQKSVDLSPSFALGHLVLGMARLYSGDAAGALRPLEHGLRLNPYDPQNFHWFRILALAYYFSGRTEVALEAALKALNVRPSWPFTLETVAVCYVALGQLQDAKETLDRMRQLAGRTTDPTMPLRVLNPTWSDQISAMLRSADRLG
jgi:TolB-like protein